MDNDDLKYKKMQDEMSRFEAEISGNRGRQVIGSATYGNQQRLQGNSSSMPGPLLPPPAAPFIIESTPSSSSSSSSLLVPAQLQKSRLPPPTASFSSFTETDTSFAPPLTPAKPQPIVLTSAPQLYRKSDKKRVEEVEEIDTTPHILPTVTTMPEIPIPHHVTIPSLTSSHKPSKKEKKNRKLIRTAGGQVWEDLSLMDWPDDDFRLFCGDLGNDVTDELLIRTFSKYSSFCKAKVIRDKRTNKSKGFGFISFREPADFIKAMKEMNGRYVGSRPIKLRKSTWRNRSLDAVRKKEKEKAALITMLTNGANKSHHH